MAASHNKDTDDLIDRVQSLPRELYDEIFDLTFTTPANTHVNIGRGYVPPSHLAVDHATRVKATQSYYSVSIFHFGDRGTVLRWLLSLQRAQRQQIHRIEWDWSFRRDREGEALENISKFFENEAQSLYCVLSDLRMEMSIVRSIHVPQFCQWHECWELVSLGKAMLWKRDFGKPKILAAQSRSD